MQALECLEEAFEKGEPIDKTGAWKARVYTKGERKNAVYLVA